MIPDVIATLPKVDLHIHQEVIPRLDQVLALRENRQPYDWQAWVAHLMTEVPPGMPRLQQLGAIVPVSASLDANDELFVARIEHLLLEEAQDGAILTEMRVGNETLLRPDFMPLFREAEQRVQQHYPNFHAEVVNTLLLWWEPERLERMVAACIRMADEGLRGIDLLYQPYDTEADWTKAYRVGERLVDSGLGITAHAGEFSTANLAAALRMPGLTRIGHATQAVHEPELMELLAKRQVTVECSLSCNVVLGAMAAYDQHPLRQFIDAGIPVALGTDDPIQILTTIGREYAHAHQMGLSAADLLSITRNAIKAAFTTETCRELLQSYLANWEPET